MKIKLLLFFCLLLFNCKTDSNQPLENTVNIRLQGKPRQLNPIMSTTMTSDQVEWQMFMPLLQYDAKDISLSPVLARSRPIVESIKDGIYEGGQSYTFRSIYRFG